jgi:hypothetical protein
MTENQISGAYDAAGNTSLNGALEPRPDKPREYLVFKGDEMQGVYTKAGDALREVLNTSLQYDDEVLSIRDAYNVEYATKVMQVVQNLSGLQWGSNVNRTQDVVQLTLLMETDLRAEGHVGDDMAELIEDAKHEFKQPEHEEATIDDSADGLRDFSDDQHDMH